MSSNNNNNKTAINTLIWNTPPSEIHDEFREDLVFSVNVRYDNRELSKEYDGIKRIVIEISDDIDLTSQPFIIPYGFRYLEIHILNRKHQQYSKETADLIRRIHIPSSVEIFKLVINKIKSYGYELLEDILYCKDFNDIGDAELVKKYRKLNNRLKECNIVTDQQQQQYFIPNTVKKLSIPLVNQRIIDSIPDVKILDIQTRDRHSLNNNQLDIGDIKLPLSLDYVSISYTDKDSRNEEYLYKREEITDQNIDTDHKFILYNRPTPSTPSTPSYLFINNEIPNVFPNSIIYIKVNNYLNSSLVLNNSNNNNNSISSLDNLKYLDIYYNEYLSYNGFIPKSVRYLKINARQNEKLILPILVPSTIEYIDIKQQFSDLIRIVNSQQYYYQPQQINYFKLKKLVLPRSYCCYIPPHSLLSYGIQELTIPYINNSTSTLIIPSTVERLIIKDIDQDIQRINIELFPIKLEYLELNYSTYMKEFNSNEIMNRLFTNATYSNSDTIVGNYIDSITINSLIAQYIGEKNGELLVDKCVINYIKKTQLLHRYSTIGPPNSLEIKGQVDVDKLPNDLKDLTLNYKDNILLLSKPPQQPLETKQIKSEDRYVLSFIVICTCILILLNIDLIIQQQLQLKIYSFIFTGMFI